MRQMTIFILVSTLAGAAAGTVAGGGCGPKRAQPEADRIAVGGAPARDRVPTPTLSLAEATLPAGGAVLLNQSKAEGLGYPRYPTYHSGVVVFSAEGDLWQVSAAGGLARRLTAHRGREYFAHFSPDGKWLAFSGDYDGNQDVFVMPAVGGRPRRLTYHPASDQVLGWTPDSGAVLFRSRRFHPHRAWTLHTVALKGGMPKRLPLGRGARLTWEPEGKRVAINRISRDFRRWKRYAGGRAAQIFLGDLEGGTFRKVTTFKGTNAYPMWHGGRIYFASDRTGTVNLWSMSAAGADLKQHTRFAGFDVRFPSLSQGKIVYQHKFGLRLLDLETGKDSAIGLRIVSDALRTRVRFTSPTRYLTRYDLSPDGSYLGVEVRGNLHLVPAQKHGRRITLSRSSGSREQGLSFSPNGRWVATVSDAKGEMEVFVYDTKGTEAPRQVTRDGKCFKYEPVWSPDGKTLAFSDSENRLFGVPATGGVPAEIDRSRRGRISGYSFSPDSRWLAYAKMDDNYYSSIFLYEVATRKVVRVTDSFHDDWSPRWSPDGEYLVFLSDRTVNPILDRVDLETILDKMTKPYLVLLSKETRSPFLPRDPGQPEKKGAGPKKPGIKATGRVAIDTDGIGERIVEVPVKAGNIRGLWAGKDVLLFIRMPTFGMTDWEAYWWGKELTVPLRRFDFSKKKENAFAPAIRGYAVSEDGKKIALRLIKARFAVFPLGKAAPKGKALAEHLVALGNIREQVDPRAEWRQIFNEAWRLMRDFYWTKDMAGVDWKAMYDKYRPFLVRITTREELQDLIGEMVAELSLGHTYVWGGDQRRGRRVPVGLLGADLTADKSGFFKFARVYRGANWHRKRRAPLTLPHVGVKEGDLLLKVDGRRIKATDNVYRFLQKGAGQRISLTVGKTPNEAAARQVELKLLGSERPVRYADWVRRNRELVSQKTGGKVGYLHIPNMMSRGMVEFDRWFYPQVRKQGLIVDARWNGGGFVSAIMVKRLARKILSWRRSRHGWISPYPSNTLNGRIVVLTNESAGSDGDIFPRAIQVAKIGPVIGTRTWGGVVGISLQNPLVDRGISTRPRTFAWWEPKRRWRLEGEGVTPDIVVDNDPGAVHRGRDAQLAKGIEVVLARITRKPPHAPVWGPSPDKSKTAWVKKYGQTDKP